MDGQPRWPTTPRVALQAAGVAACEVYDSAGVLRDPQVRARHWFQVRGSTRFPDGDLFCGHPIHLGVESGAWWRAGPSMGEDTREVLMSVAGMSSAEVDALIAAGGAFEDAEPELKLRRPYLERAGRPRDRRDRRGAGVTGGPWAGIRVVELTGLTGAYATRIWAGLGADVVVAEPAEGHVLRHLPPFARATTDERRCGGRSSARASARWSPRPGARRARSCWRRPTS